MIPSVGYAGARILAVPAIMLNSPKNDPSPDHRARRALVVDDGQRMTALPSRLVETGARHGRDLSTEDLEASISSRKNPTSRSREIQLRAGRVRRRSSYKGRAVDA